MTPKALLVFADGRTKEIDHPGTVTLNQRCEHCGHFLYFELASPHASDEATVNDPSLTVEEQWDARKRRTLMRNEQLPPENGGVFVYVQRPRGRPARTT